MASGYAKESSEHQRVIALFKAGRSKAEIGRELGKTKEQVAKMLAQAIRESGNA